jgi:putative copper export protein
VYRLDDPGVLETLEALVDVVENFAHPSNAGRWTGGLAIFLQSLVKYWRKKGASWQHAAMGAGAYSRPLLSST